MFSLERDGFLQGHRNLIEDFWTIKTKDMLNKIKQEKGKIERTKKKTKPQAAQLG